MWAFSGSLGEFSGSSVLRDFSSQSGSVNSSYLPLAFVGQPVGIHQVGDVRLGDSGATSHMTRNAEHMYDAGSPPLHRSRIILGDGSTKKAQLIGTIDLVFHSSTDYPVILHGISLVPDLGFNLFPFHAAQEKHKIILNKTGVHLIDGRLVFPRRCSGSSLRATRVLPGRNTNASTASATMDMAHIDTAALPGVTSSLAVWRHVCGQRSTPAPVRGPGQERIRHSRCGETFRDRHGSLTSVQDRQRRRIHQLDVGLLLQRSLNPPRTHSPIYASVKQPRGKWTLEGHQAGTRGTT